MSDSRSARLLALFAAALVLFNFPVVGIIEALRSTLGPSAVPIYLFFSWAFVIAMAALLVEQRKGD